MLIIGTVNVDRRYVSKLVAYATVYSLENKPLLTLTLKFCIRFVYKPPTLYHYKNCIVSKSKYVEINKNHAVWMVYHSQSIEMKALECRTLATHHSH